MFNVNFQTSKEFAIILLAISLSVGVLVAAFSFRHGARYAPSQPATITVSGQGKVSVKPDIATISFTVREVGKTVAEAQKMAETKVAELSKGLADLSIKDTDIKTDYYNVSPKYTYNQIYCITAPCPTGKQTLDGYEVTETVTVKVRDLDKAGDALALVGKADITEVTGPNFSVDKIETVQADAKEEAIKDARMKAEATASSLHVRLSKIVNYSEDGGYRPMYDMYSKGVMAPMAAGAPTSVESVTLPTGETTVNATVSITYEIED